MKLLTFCVLASVISAGDVFAGIIAVETGGGSISIRNDFGVISGIGGLNVIDMDFDSTTGDLIVSHLESAVGFDAPVLDRYTAASNYGSFERILHAPSILNRLESSNIAVNAGLIAVETGAGSISIRNDLGIISGIGGLNVIDIDFDSRNGDLIVSHLESAVGVDAPVLDRYTAASNYGSFERILHAPSILNRLESSNLAVNAGLIAVETGAGSISIRNDVGIISGIGGLNVIDMDFDSLNGDLLISHLESAVGLDAPVLDRYTATSNYGNFERILHAPSILNRLETSNIAVFGSAAVPEPSTLVVVGTLFIPLSLMRRARTTPTG